MNFWKFLTDKGYEIRVENNLYKIYKDGIKTPCYINIPTDGLTEEDLNRTYNGISYRSELTSIISFEIFDCYEKGLTVWQVLCDAINETDAEYF